MDIEQAKFNMVEQQIRPWNVLNPKVLKAVSAVPRENFVPKEHHELSFVDMNIPIGDNQVMMQPKVEARMLQALEPDSNHVVLEIGSGTGYMAALLAYCAKFVETVEIRPVFIDLASNNLAENQINNVQVVEGDGGQGWQSDHQYDCIFLSGSVIELPDSYRELLNVGGRLVAIIGEEPIMNAVLVEKTGPVTWKTTYLFETVLPALDNIVQPSRFVF